MCINLRLRLHSGDCSMYALGRYLRSIYADGVDGKLDEQPGGHVYKYIHRMWNIGMA